MLDFTSEIDNKRNFTDNEDVIFAPETSPDLEQPSYSSIVSTNEFQSVSQQFQEWKILVVDDEEDVHTVTGMLLEDVVYQNKPIRLLDAYSGKQACQILDKEPDVALIFLDVVMETNHAGLEVVRYLREKLKNLRTRVILRTGQPGEAPESSVIMNYEIDDYKLKTELTAQKMMTSLIGGLRAYGTLRKLQVENQKRKKAEDLLKNAYDKLDSVFEQTVESLSSTIELRDAYTAGHARNVGKLAEAIALEMNLPPDRSHWLKMAGFLHDIGKIKIPMDVLSKTDELSEEDWYKIKEHPQTGYNLLKNIDFPIPLARIVLEHHEFYNGEGYPNNKPNEQLLIESQILAVADVLEAMMLARPYRRALGKFQAISELSKNKGSHFNPEVVDACIKVLEKGFEFDETT